VEAGKPADYRYPKKIRSYTNLGKIEKRFSSLDRKTAHQLVP
jgi:hypothetical protein